MRPHRTPARPGHRGLPRRAASSRLGRNRPEDLVGRHRQGGRPPRPRRSSRRRNRTVRADARRRALRRRHHAGPSRPLVVRRPCRNPARAIPPAPCPGPGSTGQPTQRRHGWTPDSPGCTATNPPPSTVPDGRCNRRIGSGPDSPDSSPPNPATPPPRFSTTSSARIGTTRSSTPSASAEACCPKSCPTPAYAPDS